MYAGDTKHLLSIMGGQLYERGQGKLKLPSKMKSFFSWFVLLFCTFKAFLTLKILQFHSIYWPNYLVNRSEYIPP